MTSVVIDPSRASEAGWAQRLTSVSGEARAAAGDVDAAIRLARDVGAWAPRIGEHPALRRWELLATLGAVDLTVARVLEPHLDAVDILAQAGLPAREPSTWGVYAAEGPGMRVVATPDGEHWRLDGVKPWCSLAGRLDRALITAGTGDGTRRLFECSLADAGVAVGDTAWIARGLVGVGSAELRLDGVMATPVGPDGWYLERPGFAWGGIGVAAIWFGAAVAIARRIRTGLGDRDPDQIALMHLGESDVLLHSCAAVLTAAAAQIDRPGDERGAAHPSLLAHRVRSAVAAAAERIITIAGHALGPAPLAFDEEHARRIADLQLFLRQDHAERDLARLGSRVAALEAAPW